MGPLRSFTNPLRAPAPLYKFAQHASGAEVSYGDIFKQFAVLGWTAFGGPAAHLGMFEKTFVEKLKWMR